MRLVQVTIPRGERERILAALDDEGVDYVVTDETSGREYEAIAHLPLPTNAVEPVLKDLREAGLDDEAFTVVLEASTVVSRRFEELQDRYANEEATGDRIAREELSSAAYELAPSRGTFAVMTVISALIATAGLLLNSPAIVVGSMVIAPLIGPAMAASVGTVLRDTELFRRGVRLQATGLALAVLAATGFALVVRYSRLFPPTPDVFTVPQIRERVAPDALSLVVAIGSGAAGVISLSSGVSTALVGVMIAVALLPPAATVGIGIAWGNPLVTLGSTVLLLVNVLSINLAAIVVLWYTGYRPEHLFRSNAARSATVKRVAVLAIAIVVLSTFLGGVTYDSYQRATIQEQLRGNVADTVSAINGTVDFRVALLDIDVQYTNTALFRRVDAVVVTVGVSPGETYSGMSNAIDAAIEDATGHDVDLEVRYVPTEFG